MRIYADPAHYEERFRKDLTDIVKASWNNATADERRQRYGAWIDHFEVVSTPDNADVHLLTMKWQHYVEHQRIDQARRAIDVARIARKPVAVFSMGDFEANFPVAGKDIHLFQAAGYRSRQQTQNHGMPPFFDDPLESRGGEVQIRDKRVRPSIGFCGQAGASLPRHAARFVRSQLRQLQWRLGRLRWEPPPFEHTWFRQRVLDTLASNPAVETRYVLRKQYRAGVLSARRLDPAEKSRREFVENVLGTDYTVCMRGGGNFSVRFYEALAMGRIPVFVDTDCVLPYQHRIDWRKYAVWIDQRHLHDAGRIVADFHSRLSPEQFRELQLACRRIWQERLTADGFYRHFREHFEELQ
ncbi:MAG: exostosin family protein [Kofleriaceae bacterium]|nr:exostosin family protein [Kofleriaceae bacterium]